MPIDRLIKSLDMKQKINSLISKDIKRVGSKIKEEAQNDIMDLKNIGWIGTGTMGMNIALKIK